MAPCHAQTMAIDLTEEQEQPKYIVFKREEWEDTVDPLGNRSFPTPLDDAVVIRLKDPFAATALFTYANTIMSWLELSTELPEEKYNDMLWIADYFHQQACESQKIKDKRLPD
jgi:hypothetical protein